MSIKLDLVNQAVAPVSERLDRQGAEARQDRWMLEIERALLVSGGKREVSVPRASSVGHALVADAVSAPHPETDPAQAATCAVERLAGQRRADAVLARRAQSQSRPGGEVRADQPEDSYSVARRAAPLAAAGMRFDTSPVAADGIDVIAAPPAAAPSADSPGAPVLPDRGIGDPSAENAAARAGHAAPPQEARVVLPRDASGAMRVVRAAEMGGETGPAAAHKPPGQQTMHVAPPPGGWDPEAVQTPASGASAWCDSVSTEDDGLAWPVPTALAKMAVVSGEPGIAAAARMVSAATSAHIHVAPLGAALSAESLAAQPLPATEVGEAEPSRPAATQDRRGEAEAFAKKLMHVYLAEDGMHAWIRDAGLGPAQVSAVVQAMTSEFAAGGTRLAALSINGKAVVEQGAGDEGDEREGDGLIHEETRAAPAHHHWSPAALRQGDA